jgi:hypothetical protein
MLGNSRPHDKVVVEPSLEPSFLGKVSYISKIHFPENTESLCVCVCVCVCVCWAFSR